MTRSTTDHELLVGLLALQNGLIQQAQLVAAFQAWTCEKSRSLAEHLVDMGYLNLIQRSAVEAIAGLHVEAHGGDLVRSLISVPTEPAVRSRLAMLGDSELEATIGRIGILSDQTDHDGDRTASPTHSSTSTDGQRFRVLRPHARGGLGAVFVAIDSELNREVALKQILDDHADDPTSRQRFVIEAEITGGLEHPGIVPVYGLGTDRNDRPYYAMRFVRGDSLKEAIGDLHGDSALRSDPGRRSLELRKLLRRFTDVCNAIDYAHARGVLHRDIKPANIILGKHGETLVVDWGLAKSKGRPDPAAEERTLRPGPDREVPETLAGSAMGTPAYMSPEQALGELDRLTVRSDVFGLGATLYSLLAGVPPFVGDDAQSILRAAQECKPRPPRALDPLVPCTLEAICLKALARDPAARYASAGVLAEDVERWMADEPTSAREESTAERVSRWIRRRRTTVAALGPAMLVALMALGTILGFQSNINARLRAANQKVLHANANLRDANKREGRRFDLALRAIQNYSDGLTDDQHLRQREFDALRGKLLGGALGYYAELEETLAKD